MTGTDNGCTITGNIFGILISNTNHFKNKQTKKKQNKRMKEKWPMIFSKKKKKTTYNFFL